MLGIGMTKCFKLLMCAYGAVICKLWSAIENLAVDAKIKSVVFLLWIWQWAVPLATKQRETGTYYHITDLGVLSNSGHDIIRLLSFASLQTTMGICHHVTNVIYDLAGAVTRILTCGKFKVGGYSPTLSHNNHHRHCRFQGQGRTIVAELFLLLCLMSSVTSIVWDTANAQQAKGGRHIYPFVFFEMSVPAKPPPPKYQNAKLPEPKCRCRDHHCPPGDPHCFHLHLPRSWILLLVQLYPAKHRRFYQGIYLHWLRLNFNQSIKLEKDI